MTDGVSPPLPTLEVRRLSAERGADDVREHLDSAPCHLCGCPDADLVRVEIPWTSKFGMRRVCRGHVEHPDHPGYAARENPTQCRYCTDCGDPCLHVFPNGQCSNCARSDLEGGEQR